MAKVKPKTFRQLIDMAHRSSQFKEFLRFFNSLEIKSWLKADEMALHYGLAAFGNLEPCCVEIGTFEGASALFTLAGMQERGAGTLYSVDPHLGAPPYLGAAPWQFTFSKFMQNIRKSHFEGRLVSLMSDSVTASAVWPARPISSVFIDADHSYIGCLRDIECWAPKLENNGFVLIDDADDDALPELLLLIEDLKTFSSLQFIELIDGIAVFQRDTNSKQTLSADLSQLARSKGIHRPWDLSFVQNMKPGRNYNIEAVHPDNGRQTAYQLGFLSRCEPGDYAVSRSLLPEDTAIVDHLIETRDDGQKLWIEDQDIRDSTCRFVLCRVEQAPLLAPSLKPGGVLVARSALEPIRQNELLEHGRMEASGLTACGWVGQTHWGIWRPHFLSPDATMEYILQNMA